MRAQSSDHAPLWRLAHACGILPAYTDVYGRRKRAQPTALLRAIQAYGLDVPSTRHAQAALEALMGERADQLVEPVCVAWLPPASEMRGDAHVHVRLNIPEHLPRALLECNLQTEAGDTLQWTTSIGRLSRIQQNTAHGPPSYTAVMSVPGPLPLGYHTLTCSLGHQEGRCWLFVAPQHAKTYLQKQWGVFTPLYAVRSQHNWGAGDFTDLHNLASWVRSQGGSMLSTLPLLASYLREDVLESSPYMPISRLFWNEFYIDVESVPEYQQALREGQSEVTHRIQRKIHTLRRSSSVDYASVMSLKRRVLMELAQHFFRDKPGLRWQRFISELENNRELAEYAHFRTLTDKHETTWQHWRNPHAVADTPCMDDPITQYHLYVQFLCCEQLERAAHLSGEDDKCLYLDLPVGVHPHGYDTWRYRSAFVEGMAVGAPPDEYFKYGQNWGIAPLHPQQTRTDGHAYFRRCIREHLKYAGLLRIDHVMWLHRTYWVPSGMEADEGVYVRSPANELYAVLCIESHRAGTPISGENLGTVPGPVNRTMRRHRIAPLYVGQFSCTGHARCPLEPPEEHAVVSLNTHDTPTFAAFWRGADISMRQNASMLTPASARQESKVRERIRRSILAFMRRRGVSLPSGGQSDRDVADIARCLLLELASYNASLTLLSLDDMWAQMQPHNVPGTHSSKNWRRKGALTLEEIMADTDLAEMCRKMTEAMK